MSYDSYFQRLIFLFNQIKIEYKFLKNNILDSKLSTHHSAFILKAYVLGCLCTNIDLLLQLAPREICL